MTSAMPVVTGHLRKMIGTLSDDGLVEYLLPLSEHRVPLNALLGSTLRLQFTGTIRCKHCTRLTKKTYGQGYCFPCFHSLAECDICIIKPELCHHFTKNTCRDAAWAMNHCMQPHIIYLANTSGLKVGITRLSQVPVRWIDQGAIQALPILQVANRYQSGLVEVMLANYVSDKTNWRVLVQKQGEPMDLVNARDFLLGRADVKVALAEFDKQFQGGLTRLSDANELTLRYPILSLPDSAKAFNLSRTPLVEGRLLGIRGQYLIFDTGVLNIRKFTSYEISFQSFS